MVHAGISQKESWINSETNNDMDVKETIRYILYCLKKKPYRIRLNNNSTLIPIHHTEKDFFFGYYDKTPELNNKLIFQEKQDDNSVNLILVDLENNEKRIIDTVQSYNLQMGARMIWIDDDTISYNSFDGNKYICNWYSVSQRKIVNTFSMPLQDNYKKDYYLTVNYQRLKTFAKEYAYNCLPQMDEKSFDDYSSDGIWKMNIEDKTSNLIIPISDVLKCKPHGRFKDGKHFLNHIMISPSGETFIFIHRYYCQNRRYDRLMLSDFTHLKCLLDDPCQSHFCWVDEKHIFGYGECEGQKGFLTVNVMTGLIERHPELDRIHPKDGHPSICGDWIAIDSYPNLSRMQNLHLYNYKTKEIRLLLEVYHNLRHKGITRCDLHPRFVENNKIYFDTIYTGNRQLCCLSF